jgi:hypothetical protein
MTHQIEDNQNKEDKSKKVNTRKKAENHMKAMRRKIEQ